MSVFERYLTVWVFLCIVIGGPRLNIVNRSKGWYEFAGRPATVKS